MREAWSRYLEHMCRTYPELINLFEMVDDPGSEIIRKALKQRLERKD